MTATSTTIASAGDRHRPRAACAGSARTILVRLMGAVFLASLFVPFVGTWMHWDPADATNENRRLAVRPELPRNYRDASLYTDRWLDFYRDHFGLRNTLIRAVAIGRFHGLGDDMSGNVVVGKEGWLFLRSDGDRNFIGFRGLNPLSDSELDAWQSVLEKRQAFLAAHGIPYLVVIPPDKQTIYPEYLPAEYAPIRHVSRLDQLIERMAQTHSPVHIVDLRPALLAAKSTGLLYHRTDTHWNDLGAYAGYRVIIQAVQQILPRWNIVPQPFGNFTVGPLIPEVGDLARMMDMPDLYPDHGSWLIRKIPFPVPPEMADRNEIAVMDLHDSSKPSLILYRDSFSISLIPMLGPDFGRVVYAFRYQMDPSMIEREKPDLVITEFIERNLYINPPTDPPELRDLNARSK